MKKVPQNEILCLQTETTSRLWCFLFFIIHSRLSTIRNLSLDYLLYSCIIHTSQSTESHDMSGVNRYSGVNSYTKIGLLGSPNPSANLIGVTKRMVIIGYALLFIQKGYMV
jgi:hypothetical protein